MKVLFLSFIVLSIPENRESINIFIKKADMSYSLTYKADHYLQFLITLKSVRVVLNGFILSPWEQAKKQFKQLFQLIFLSDGLGYPFASFIDILNLI